MCVYVNLCTAACMSDRGCGGYVMPTVKMRAIERGHADQNLPACVILKDQTTADVDTNSPSQDPTGCACARACVQTFSAGTHTSPRSLTKNT